VTVHVSFGETPESAGSFTVNHKAEWLLRWQPRAAFAPVGTLAAQFAFSILLKVCLN
jgi:hypothetical protein